MHPFSIFTPQKRRAALAVQGKTFPIKASTRPNGSIPGGLLTAEIAEQLAIDADVSAPRINHVGTYGVTISFGRFTQVKATIQVESV